MRQKRAPDYHNSPTFQQLWDALGSKLIEILQGRHTFNQGVAGSSPTRPILATKSPLDPQKEPLIDNLGQLALSYVSEESYFFE